MAATAAIALGLGAAALLALGRRRGAGARGQVACDASATDAARFARSSALAWVDCTGRTASDVAALAGLLDRAGRRADAAAVRARWNARRDVEDAPPDGQVPDAAAALTGPEPRTVPEEPPARRGRVTLPGLADIERTPSSSSSSSSSSRRRVTERELPGSGYDPAEARRLAPRVARSLRSGGGYRTALTAFQRAAGVEADGLYGPESRAALRYYGVADPPPARVARTRPEVYEPPAIETDSVVLSEEP